MLSTIDVLDAVNRLLVKKWPKRPVYRNDVPQDFERPSFLLETTAEAKLPANVGLVNVKSFMAITIFEKIDEYGGMDNAELLLTAADVLELLLPPLSLFGRALTLTASYGGENRDECYVDVQTEFLTEIPKTADTQPPMGQVSITQNLEV